MKDPVMAIGEFTIFDEPVETVMESKIPALAAAIKIPNPKNMAK